MGILREPWQMVRALPLPPGFSVLELGDQYITHETPHRLAAEAYKEMGCGRYVSIDGNGRGTHLFDLNLKSVRLVEILGDMLFDLVTDFGTGEHIFDQATVWRTVHNMTKTGGHIAFDRPSQGYPGHCFYRTDESLFTDIAAANRYEIVALEEGQTKRGALVRGVFRKVRHGKFEIPNQGRYRKILVIK